MRPLDKVRQKSRAKVLPDDVNARVLVWDIETAPFVCATFDLKTDYIPHENIIQDWFIFCVCWKWLGEDRVYSVSVLDNGNEDHTDDSHVCKVVHGVLNQADVIVHQNGDRFDVPKFNARAILHGLPPIPKIPTVDTLKIARARFKFTANRLDFLGRILVNDRKEDTPRGLWMDALRGDAKAIRKMVKYCRQDVRLLEEVYLEIRGWDQRHPNMALLTDDEGYRCPNCGSDDVRKDDRPHRTRVSRYRRYQCRNCGAWSHVPGKSEVLR